MNENLGMIGLAGLLHRMGKSPLVADFIGESVPTAWKKAIVPVAGDHSHPMKKEDLVVQLADHLSAGGPSDPLDGAETQTAYPPRLLSIFALLNTTDGEPKTRSYWPLAALRMTEEAVFPSVTDAVEKDWQNYRTLWSEFERRARNLKVVFEEGGDMACYLESMLLLMQEFAWCIPSTFYRPDVSLYDHGRITSALAVVLFEKDEQTLHELVAYPKVERSLAALVGGDISGIQDFIYTITSRGAAGALRGRSFYLQLLTEVVARFVLKQLELPIANLVYAGGGNFYLLARPDDIDRLTAIQAELSRVLLKAHGGELYVALAGERLKGVDFFDGEISKAWGRVTERFQTVKRQRFSELGDDLAQVFEPQGHGGNEEQECRVCGHEHPETKPDPGSQTEENPDGVRKCPPCLAFEQLGEGLRLARFLSLQEVEAVALQDGADRPTWQETLKALGWQAEVSQKFSESLPRQRTGIVWALNDESVADLRPGPRLAVGRKLLVNVTPILTEDDRRFALGQHIKGLPKVGSVKPFDVMEAQSEGTKRLGVLRMDVDDMGRLFAQGLGEAATLSRVASLSFAIGLFFEGWVEHLAKTMGDSRVYSIYSGGDDLFFVGSWDKIVELARCIRVDLGRYAGGHPDIHASAGIALIGGKYPLYQAARDAGEAEAQAKALRWGDNQRKDAISFLNLALPWQRFGLEGDCEPNLGTAHGLMHFLARLSGDDAASGKSAPKATIQKLLRQYEQYEEKERERRDAGVDLNKSGKESILWGPWVWRSFYLLHRMAKAEGNASAKADLKQLATRFELANIGQMDWIGLAARWAELITRKES